MSREKKLAKQAQIAAEKVKSDAMKVKMTFSENKFYNDLENPIYLAGKEYEIVGGDMIERWLKRGGTIVNGTVPSAKQDAPNPSEIVKKPIEYPTLKKEETKPVATPPAPIEDEETEEMQDPETEPGQDEDAE